MGKFFFKAVESSTKNGEKQEKKIKKPKKARSYQRNKIRLMIWSVLVLFIGSSFLAIVRCNVLTAKVHSYRDQIETLNQRVKSLETKQALDVPTTNAFLIDFVRVYCEQFKDHEKQEQRKEKLESYSATLSFQTNQVPTVDTKVERVENYGYKEVNGTYVGRCYVEMTTESDTYAFILNIPFRLTSGCYQVCGLPYQESDTRKQAVKANDLTTHRSPTKLLENTEAVDKVERFVKQFLTEYAEDNRDNLNYLMEHVESLPKGVKVSTGDLKVYETEEKPIVEFELTVEYPDTGVAFKENLQLQLSKGKDHNYFIDRLIHY